MSTTPIRVLVVDDHPMFRAGLVAALDKQPSIKVIGEADNGAAAIAAVRLQPPDVVLMDLRMPGSVNGLAATARITEAFPTTAVVVLSMHEDDDSVFAALRAGAHGYLLKEASSEDITRVVVSAARGEAVFGPRIATRVIAFFSNSQLPRTGTPNFPQLTNREHETLDLLAAGLDNATIARRLNLAEKTIRNRVSDILRKLQARTRAEAIALIRDARTDTAAP